MTSESGKSHASAVSRRDPSTSTRTPRPWELEPWELEPWNWEPLDPADLARAADVHSLMGMKRSSHIQASLTSDKHLVGIVQTWIRN